MRGFVLEPDFVLSDPRVLALDCASVGGLVRLLAVAWRAACRLPADAAKLANLSGLGEAWAGSKLAGAMGEFFRAEGDGVLAIDLLEQRRRDDATREARRRAGVASGEARRTHVEHVSNTCSTPPPPTEHVSNTCSTHVRHVFAEGGAQERKPKTAKEMGGKSHATHAPAPLPAGPGQVRPPVNPLIEKNPYGSLQTQGGGGGPAVAGGEGAPEGVQKGLFPPSPAEPPGRPARTRRVTEADVAAAACVVLLYDDLVASLHRTGAGAAKAVATRAKEHDAGIEEMKQAVITYARECKTAGKAKRYCMRCDNFFAADGPWKSYIPIGGLPNGKAEAANAVPSGNPGNVGRAGRVPAPREFYAWVSEQNALRAAKDAADERAAAPVPGAGPEVGGGDPFAAGQGDRRGDGGVE